jgi:predicted dehydrogenase
MKTAASPVRLAFLGCGLATRMHARTLSAMKEDVICSFASRDPARAVATSRSWRATAHPSYAHALSDPEIAAVIVTTPPVTHLALTLEALAAGKHVIVEKPAFVRSSDFDVVEAAAARAGRRVLVAENYFYKPLTGVLRRLVAGGVIGDVRFVHVNALKQQVTAGWRDDAALAGGGALLEGGVHWINFLASIGLTIASVHGTRAGNAEDELERSMLVSLRFAEGAAGTLLYSWEIPGLLRGLRLSRIFGTRGSITFETNGLFVATRGERYALTFPGLRDIAGYRSMFTDFIRVLRDDAEPQMTLARARADVSLVEAIYRSSCTDALLP